MTRPRRKTVFLAVGLLAVAGAVLLVVDKGPLGHMDRRSPESGGANVCVPTGDARQATLGSVRFSQQSGRVVEILEVSLINADGIILIDALILPVYGGSSGLGAARGFPPDLSNSFMDNIRWSETIPAAGARVEPDDLVQRDLVLGLELEAGREIGISEAVRVRYRSGWRSYAIELAFAYMLTDRPTCDGLSWPD